MGRNIAGVGEKKKRKGLGDLDIEVGITSN
jgi:hypothetical protein